VFCSGSPWTTSSIIRCMIQCRLRELIAAKGRRERRKITYEDIRAETGIDKSTLTRLTNDRADRVAISTIDRLCAYLSCQPGDLFIYVEGESPVVPEGS
jgi:putative transcriptional regulator